MVGEVREYDELADIYQKLDTVRITSSLGETDNPLLHLFEIVIILYNGAPQLNGEPHTNHSHHQPCEIPRA